MLDVPSCNRGAMEKLKDRVLQFFQSGKDVKLPARLVETIAASFIIVTSVVVYTWGAFFIVPEVFAESSWSWVIAFQILGTWILIGVLSNMYLVRKRNSSIRNRMILQPVVQHLSPEVRQLDADVQLREHAKHLSEHFTPNPFGSDHNYHICAVCEIFVPPRTWHCHICDTCIIRRDHHCVFTGCCIGEENQSNFLGLVLYLSLGTTLVSSFCLYYALYLENLSLWWYLFRTMCMVYTFFWDFDLRFIIASITSVGQLLAWPVLLYYILMAMKGQTSADAHKRIIRTLPGEKTVSYCNMRRFLGPKPFLRIIWPFHTPLKTDYSSPISGEQDQRKFM